MKCPKCQTELPETANFCFKCGEGLNEEKQPPRTSSIPEAERKRVTALFSDLSGYTSMTEKLDPEEVKEITGRVFEDVKEVVHKYEGFIERFAGDGVLALFGVPKSHEDDPIRAVHAAKEIHGLVESLSPQYQARIGRALSMHSGVNTGLAVTADVNPEKGTHGVTGDAINVAARLSDLARAREILVGPDTYRACQSHFRFEPLTPAKVKGKSEPIPIYKLLATKVSAPHVLSGRQVSSEMVGRDKELDRLELQIMKAVNGEGSVVNVIGEAGIGKSRLIAELKERDVIKRVTLLEGRAISIGKNLSFHPIIDLLKQWAGIAEDDSGTAAFDKLEKAIRAVHPEETNEILPFVATLMGMKLTGKHEERVKGIEGEGLEKLILKNVRDLVNKGSELRPTVIIMEDIHWADTSSIELLESLYRLAEKQRIAFVNVFRPGYFDSDDRAVAKVGERLPVYYVGIEIQPLDKDNSETLINNILEIKGLPYLLKTQIVERAGGNPFFIEEVVRSLIDEGAVVRKDGGFAVTEKIAGVVIPPTINDVLMARIDRLEERTRELVKVASVIGRSFFDRIIRDVAASIEDMDYRLAYLKDIQLIRDRTRMKELEYLFKHALAQEAAYESTLIQQRKALHLKVAQSIEKIFQERLYEFFGMLAYHYSKGEDLEKAEEYMTKAGEEALRSSASSEALNYFQEALRLYVEKYKDAADPEKLASFEKNMALAFWHKGQHANAVKYFDLVLSRWGAGSPENKLRKALRLILDSFAVLINLYLLTRRRTEVPTTKENLIFDLAYKRQTSLTYVDSKRLVTEAVSLLRRSAEFDTNRIETGDRFWFSMGGLMAFSGISFTLAKRFLATGKDFQAKNDPGDIMAYMNISTVVNSFSGSWTSIGPFADTAVDQALASGEFWDASSYIYFYGLAKAEQGQFEELRMAIQRLSEIAKFYQYGQAAIWANALTVELLIKKRKLHEAQAEAEKLISLTVQSGAKHPQVKFMGFKLMAQIMQEDVAGAEESIFRIESLIAGQAFPPPIFLSTYRWGRFLTDIHLLKEAPGPQHEAKVRDYRSNAYQSGKAALKNSRKFVPYRTKILCLMGTYYWLIGKQGKAMKWWDRAIKEGERLGARPDLSRTYFEVGKRLLEPESKYKELNGIEAKSYLKKAGILFEEMGLERDLDDLDKIASDS